MVYCIRIYNNCRINKMFNINNLASLEDALSSPKNKLTSQILVISKKNV